MTINLDPHALGLHWTTLLTLIGGIASLAWLMSHSPMFRLSRRTTYSIVLKAAFWAILGARVVHVLDYADYYRQVPFQMFYLWNGGESAWGALLAGAVGALWHARRAGADAVCFANLLTYPLFATLALGRLGDFLAGERIGTSSSLPWAVTYLNPRSAAFGLGGMHPVALYEALLVCVLLIGVWQLRRRTLVPNGLPVAFAGYAVIRFVLGFVTVQHTHLGLDMAQWVAIAVLAVVGWRLWRSRVAVTLEG